jgi:glycosyltransferase involved in cell wall biosynthesis
VVNVFFAPQSFGGATIVAEEIAQRLSANWEVFVITTTSKKELAPYHTIRYKAKGVDVLSINLPQHLSRFDKYVNKNFAYEFAKNLKVIAPDIVHFHSIQNLGAEILEATRLENIPSIVTIHDNWWICERQFMIDRFGEYCHQSKIDLTMCKSCMHSVDASIANYGDVRYRFDYLGQMLKKFDYLLFPSAFQKQIYRYNTDIEDEKLIVNKNGVKLANKNYQKSPSKKVRFGFVGGMGPIKGFEQIKRAFARIEREDYALHIVDNTLNLGFSSIKIDESRYQGEIKIVPAYTQESMDAFYANIDVLLFPSQWKESFGLTVREALSRDIWVIATNAGGVVEDIVDGENGAIIPMDGEYMPLYESVMQSFEIDFTRYRNAHKASIASFDSQAQAIDLILKKALRKKDVN